jgi:septum formation protein
VNHRIDLCLASASPRRLALLEQLGLVCQQYPVDLDESIALGESAADYVLRLAEEKARAGQSRSGSELPVLGSDTSVVFQGQILGKPKNETHAVEMLMLLSGRTHQVMTGVAVCQGDRLQSVLSITEVKFRPLTRQECHAYWVTGEPEDKAGGYAIQGMAAIFVESVSGSYSNVVGLPLFETAELLKQYDIQILERP